ncbi:MAG TPA: ABC transporter permease, partial [Polyangiaceae bacterium]|nr:ABC transporter permease [Polyangiaceae bacterium]
MSERLNPLVELVQARLREFWREPGIVFWVFGFPLLMALGLGLAFRSKVPEKPEVAVVVIDGSARAEGLARTLSGSDALKAHRYASAEAFRALTHARVDVIVELSESGAKYRFDPTQDKSPHAQLLVDGLLQSASGQTRPLAT